MIETIPPISTDKVKWRQLQYLQPGHWVLIEYENDEGQRFSVWSQIEIRLTLEDRVEKRKLEELRGRDAQGDPWLFRQYSGFELRFLTERDGERAGLTIPEPGGEAA